MSGGIVWDGGILWFDRKLIYFDTCGLTGDYVVSFGKKCSGEMWRALESFDDWQRICNWWFLSYVRTIQLDPAGPSEELDDHCGMGHWA